MEGIITPLNSAQDGAACAGIMIASEPWITFRTTYDEALSVINDPDNETFIFKLSDGTVAGFVTITLKGSLPGYIKRIAVSGKHRSVGMGKELMMFAEQRILPRTKNVFLCVSDFNPGAIDYYLNLGYEKIGEIKDYLVNGKREFIMRKTAGPLKEIL
ncbi:MAG: GNAT family N-acetyltransferase [Ignavibacteriaceae bacterium]|nr:GNAT family N-acetyltransferase [Ignavibacteriaceae bacterium]